MRADSLAGNTVSSFPGSVGLGGSGRPSHHGGRDERVFCGLGVSEGWLGFQQPLKETKAPSGLGRGGLKGSKGKDCRVLNPAALAALKLAKGVRALRA